MTFKMGLITCALLAMTSLILAAPSMQNTFGFHSLGKSSERFATDLYQKLSKEKGNILISPSSLQTVLALVQMAANDQTLNEMSRTLQLPIDKVTVQNAFKELLPYLKSTKHSILSSANKIYVKDGFDINQNYSKLAMEAFNAELETKNFTDSEKTANDINKWVEYKTNNKIKNLVKEDMIDSLTVLILINALYFKGEWEVPFVQDLTTKRKFFINATHWENVDMMFTEHYSKYYEDDALDAKFLELPYSENEFTMTFVVPNKRDGLPVLEAQLAKVLDQQDMMREMDVAISIPKFKIEQDVNFNEILQELGMVEAFREDADLSDFSISKRDLHISYVIQKTFIDVNEKGTEAAAASASFVVDRISGGQPMFIADRPFLFVLRQSSTNIVQFIGRYSNPEAYQSKPQYPIKEQKEGFKQ